MFITVKYYYLFYNALKLKKDYKNNSFRKIDLIMIVPKEATDRKAWKELAFDKSDPNKLEKLTKDQLAVYVLHFNLP